MSRAAPLVPAAASRHGDVPLLDVRGLTVAFGGEQGDGLAINDVSLSLRRSKILGLVGESGSGKSVTGLALMGLIEAPGRIVAGQVLFDGTDLARLDDRAMRQWRGKRIAMIFQDPMMTLNPVLRIDTQMIETVLAHDDVSPAEARSRARDALGQVGIPRTAEEFARQDEAGIVPVTLSDEDAARFLEVFQTTQWQTFKEKAPDHADEFRALFLK